MVAPDMADAPLGRRLVSAGGDLIVPALLLGYATHYYLGVRALPRPDVNLLLIEPVYVILLICCVLYAVLRVMHAMQGGASDPNAPVPERVEPAKSMVFVGLTLLYAFLIPVVGFVTISTLYIFAMCVALGIRGWRAMVLVSVLTVAVLWLCIEYWLGLPLPRGALF